MPRHLTVLNEEEVNVDEVMATVEKRTWGHRAIPNEENVIADEVNGVLRSDRNAGATVAFELAPAPVAAAQFVASTMVRTAAMATSETRRMASGASTPTLVLATSIH